MTTMVTTMTKVELIAFLKDVPDDAVIHADRIGNWDTDARKVYYSVEHNEFTITGGGVVDEELDSNKPCNKESENE